MALLEYQVPVNTLSTHQDLMQTKTVWLSNPALSHEILIKNYFVAKPFKKGLNTVVVKF